MSSFFERLREERARLSLSQEEVATAGGVQRRAQVNYEAGERSPTADYLAAVAGLGIDVLYLLTGRREERDTGGRGPRLYAVSSDVNGLDMGVVAHIARESTGAWLAGHVADPARSDTTEPGGFHRTDDGRRHYHGALLPGEQGAALQPLVLQLLLGSQSGEIDYHVIPRRVLPAAAGRGVAASANDLRQIDLAGDMAFSSDWLRQNLGHTTGSICSVKVQGDSMSSTLLDGETILVDQGVSQIEVDGIYVLEIYGRQLVKRVQRLFDGALVLISDNEQYQREQIPRDQARDVVVVGRMVYPRVR